MKLSTGAKPPPAGIREFQGQYRWLSNFWSALVVYDGDEYPTVEHAYQSAKVPPHKRHPFRTPGVTAGQAKKLGRQLAFCEDWDDVKDEIMEDLVRQKFTNHPGLRQKLLETGNQLIEEGNPWGDRYWGACRGSGQNRLGKLIMKIRAELQAALEST